MTQHAKRTSCCSCDMLHACRCRTCSTIWPPMIAIRGAHRQPQKACPLVTSTPTKLYMQLDTRASHAKRRFPNGSQKEMHYSVQLRTPHAAQSLDSKWPSNKTRFKRATVGRSEFAREWRASRPAATSCESSSSSLSTGRPRFALNFEMFC